MPYQPLLLLNQHFFNSQVLGTVLIFAMIFFLFSHFFLAMKLLDGLFRWVHNEEIAELRARNTALERTVQKLREQLALLAKGFTPEAREVSRQVLEEESARMNPVINREFYYRAVLAHLSVESYTREDTLRSIQEILVNFDKTIHPPEYATFCQSAAYGFFTRTTNIKLIPLWALRQTVPWLTRLEGSHPNGQHRPFWKLSDIEILEAEGFRFNEEQPIGEVAKGLTDVVTIIGRRLNPNSTPLGNADFYSPQKIDRTKLPETTTLDSE